MPELEIVYRCTTCEFWNAHEPRRAPRDTDFGNSLSDAVAHVQEFAEGWRHEVVALVIVKE